MVVHLLLLKCSMFVSFSTVPAKSYWTSVASCSFSAFIA